MDKSPLQTNLQNFMEQHGFNMKSLSITAGLNETAVRDILRGKVNSPTYKTLNKLAIALNCNVDNLISDKTSHSNLTYKLSSIDVRLFAKSIAKIDELIKTKQISLSNLDRAKVYLAWYDLSVINRLNKNKIDSEESQFAAILKKNQ